MNKKMCSKCKVEKELKEFCYSKTTNDKLSYWCKSCKSEYSKRRYINNKEKILNQHKLYDELHKKEKKERHQKYYLKNKEKIYHYNFSYIKSKRKNDKLFRMKMQVRNMIRFSFVRKGKNKSMKTEQIIGISLIKLYDYLLETFKKNYNYEYNDEEVEIDHIIPLSTAKSEQEIINLCHYTNLQLLKKKDNREKHNKLIKN